MTKNKKYLTPWLQDILAEFKSRPSEMTFHEMLDSPLPERIKSALRDAYRRWKNRRIIVIPRKRDRERERNT